MKGLLALLGAIVFGALGWYLGSRISITMAFVIAAIGIGLGIYAGMRWATRNTA